MKKILIVDDVDKWRDFNSNVVRILLNEDVIIETAPSAALAYNKVLENNNSPYDIIITDMQMEDDYAPKHAGEWLIEQIKTLPKYNHTKIVIVSATFNLRSIADALKVDFIPKSTALNSISAYEEIIK